MDTLLIQDFNIEFPEAVEIDENYAEHLTNWLAFELNITRKIAKVNPFIKFKLDKCKVSGTLFHNGIKIKL